MFSARMNLELELSTGVLFEGKVELLAEPEDCSFDHAFGTRSVIVPNAETISIEFEDYRLIDLDSIVQDRELTDAETDEILQYLEETIDSIDWCEVEYDS